MNSLKKRIITIIIYVTWTLMYVGNGELFPKWSFFLEIEGLR